MTGFFQLRGTLSKKNRIAMEILGPMFFLFIWWLAVATGMVKESILASPIDVLTSFKELHFEDALILNALYSIKLNVLGYIEAVALAIPLGFAIALLPYIRGMNERSITSLRYLPLTALTGLFVLWFDIGDNMKVQFLALGIFVYLLPTVIQRIDEVRQVYIDTATTCGANNWQTIRTVYIPAVLATLSDDIRVLVAISWTYIIIAEITNMRDGGIGALITQASRDSRVDKVFACLAVIILIGFLQDKTWLYFDKMLFPHKHAIKKGGH